MPDGGWAGPLTPAECALLTVPAPPDRLTPVLAQSGSTLAQDAWSWLHPWPTASDLSGVAEFSPSRVRFVGDNRTLLELRSNGLSGYLQPDQSGRAILSDGHETHFQAVVVDPSGYGLAIGLPNAGPWPGSSLVVQSGSSSVNTFPHAGTSAAIFGLTAFAFTLPNSARWATLSSGLPASLPGGQDYKLRALASLWLPGGGNDCRALALDTATSEVRVALNCNNFFSTVSTSRQAQGGEPALVLVGLDGGTYAFFGGGPGLGVPRMFHVARDGSSRSISLGSSVDGGASGLLPGQILRSGASFPSGELLLGGSGLLFEGRGEPGERWFSPYGSVAQAPAIRGVGGSSRQSAWAVGADGLILRRDCTGWKQYSQRHFSEPVTEIVTLAGEGLLWAFAGPVRASGATFEPWRVTRGAAHVGLPSRVKSPGLGSTDSVGGVACSADETCFWAGFDGTQSTLFVRPAFGEFAPHSTLPRPTADVTALDATTLLTLGREGDAGVVTRNQVGSSSLTPTWTTPVCAASKLAVDSTSQTVWAAGEQGCVARLSVANGTSSATPQLPPSRHVHDLAAPSESAVFLATDDSLQHWRDGGWVDDSPDAGAGLAQRFNSVWSNGRVVATVSRTRTPDGGVASLVFRRTLDGGSWVQDRPGVRTLDVLVVRGDQQFLYLGTSNGGVIRRTLPP